MDQENQMPQSSSDNSIATPADQDLSQSTIPAAVSGDSYSVPESNQTVSNSPQNESVPAENSVGDQNTSNEPKDGNGPSLNNSDIRKLVIGVGILAVLCILWYFSNQQMERIHIAPLDQEQANITVSKDQEQGTVTIIEEGSQDINESTDAVASENMTIVKVYYLNTKNNPNVKNCSKVELLEKQTEKKYDSQIINTMRGLLEPLTPQQQADGWSSAIPAGVLLKSVVIRDGGVAEVNFTSGLKRIAGSCAVTAARAQIQQTLKQFPGIKSVRICIEGNCNQSQILQP